MDIRRFSNILSTLTLLLPLQFLLGIWVNLFVKVPDPAVRSFFISGGGIVLDIHILNALTIATLSIVAIVLGKRLKSAGPFRLSIIATLFVILAIASGITFIFFGQNDAFSFTMALGFVFSVVIFSFAGRAAMQLR